MRFVLTLLCLILASEMAMGAAQPKPNKTDYLVSTSAGFLLSKEDGAAYGMNYEVRKPLPGPIYCVALFDNPDVPDAPIKKEFDVAADAKEIQVQSPGIRTIQNNHLYKVRLMLYVDPGRTKLLSEHDQEVLFSMPKNMVSMLHDQYGIDIK